ncbi:sugar phosphate nucleotidyltransferase [Leptolyngbya sp. 7M]|uniref:sugar phosphate nucleotidyltransferase n=1 Tax=Leptolyngbya sp. 7M TaxID=2812896 RepID=UPI001B8D7499|nr:NDP-sugar synthase [Leptolyngbya sp. 7M]QYO66732.1 NDP-sugar synthase [Leptolyngbya sp. 7M]
MKAMILAAGFGTRLFPLTIDRTKPAIPFLGKPLVGYVAEYIARFGFKEIVVNLHHQPDSVIRALGDGSAFGVHIEYSLEEPEILGTAGALDNARHLLGDEAFLIVNGKIISDIDITAAVETHRRSNAIATMVLKPNIKRERFTVVETAEGYVTAFGGMAEPLTEVEIRDTDQLPRSPLMFTGIHILEPRVFDYIPKGQFSDIVSNIYRPALADGEKIAAHITDGNWYELSTIPRYLDISLAMMVDQSVFTGKGCSISSESSVRDSVIWDDVTIEAGSALYRTIVADGVVIRKGEHFENSAIVRADMVRNCDEIPEKSLKGYFQGENFIVPFG